MPNRRFGLPLSPQFVELGWHLLGRSPPEATPPRPTFISLVFGDLAEPLPRSLSDGSRHRLPP